MKKHFFTIAISLSLLALHQSARATIRYVKPVTSGSGDGSSWINASSDLQAMINASASGDEVWMAAGVYKPLKDQSGNSSPSDVRTKTFLLNKNITIYGGFTGTEGSLNQRDFVNNTTILSGDIDNNDTNTDANNIVENVADRQGNNAYHVLICSNGILDGLIITAGHASGSENEGGGVLIPNGAPAFKNIKFYGNEASDGGAMNISGSGIQASNCIFVGNKGSYGGAISARSGQVTLTNTLFSDNLSTTYGGAIEANGATPVLLINCTVSKNSSNFRGGAIYLSQSTSITLQNSILWANTASNSGNNYYFSQSSTGNASYSLVQGSGGSGGWNASFGTDGGNNLDKDPLFLDKNNPEGTDGKFNTADDGFQLTECSSGVNTGNSTGAPTSDLAYSIRPYGGIIDIGAYEFSGTPTYLDEPTSVSSNLSTIDCGGSVTLSGNCSSGVLTWYTSNNGTSNIGTGTGLNVSPNSNQSYFAACEEASGCSSLNRVKIDITVIAVEVPTNITANKTEGCYGENVTYSAACASGTITWYRLNVSSSQGTGTTFTKALTGITYQVACKESANCESDKVNVPAVNIAVPAAENESSNINNICTGNSVLLNATCQTGTIAWFDAYSSGNLIGYGTGLKVFPTTANYRYYAECQTASCNTSRTSSVNINVSSNVAPDVPSSVTVNDTEVCINSNVTLNAQCNSSNLLWYNQAVGGSSIGTGQSFSATVTATVTYYASCEDVNCTSDRVATAEVTVLPSSGGIPSNQTLTGNITGTDTKQAIEYIDATNKIIAPANVVYESGKAINFDPGFEVENGSVFLGTADLVACP